MASIAFDMLEELGLDVVTCKTWFNIFFFPILCSRFVRINIGIQLKVNKIYWINKYINILFYICYSGYLSTMILYYSDTCKITTL